MSSTVNIISETIKNTLSIPIQSLVSRPKNFEELAEEDKRMMMIVRVIIQMLKKVSMLCSF